MLTLPEIWHTHGTISPHVTHTPLVGSPFLSELSGAELYLKLECQQPTGSFKVRGALNKVGHLTAAEKEKGIVVASAGNHALGVAYAVQALGAVTADIFVPATAPTAKVQKLRRFPVNLHLVGQTYAAAQQAAADYAAQTGGTNVPAYNDPAVIAGQATVALEIFSDLPQTDVILVPVGGGALIAGIALVAKAINPHCRVIGVQPQASPAALLSLRDGKAYDPFDHEPTLADGLAGGFGPIPLRVAAGLIDQVLLATEVDLRRSIFTLLDQEQLVVEASGAIAIAPLLPDSAPAAEVDLAGKKVVCVLSGGNLDTTLLRDILVEFTP